MSCCNSNLYDDFFDKEHAQQELDDYRQNGLKDSSNSLLLQLDKLPLQDKTFLDIGGGIGGLTFELFKKGIRYATHIDMSNANVETFREEIQSRALSHKVKSLAGDFIELEEKVSRADLVVLDKVICCYENFEELVSRSTAKSINWFVYSIPRSRWHDRLYFYFDALRDRMKGKYFHMYFHPKEEIERIASKAGFEKKAEILAGRWRIITLQKSSEIM